jgi:FkbM family methyltransferase
VIYEIAAHGERYEIEAHPDSLLAQRLERGIPYEPHLLEHIYERGAVGTAIDVGAHIGNHSLWMAVVCGLEVKAFEPLFHRELRDNVERNGCDVTVFPLGLGAAMGSAVDTGDRVLSSPGKDEKRRHRYARAEGKLTLGKGSITIAPLDYFDFRGVSLMKIDVEEMEPMVLRGAEATIARERPVIFAEARDDAAHDAVAAVLEPWGYSQFIRWRKGTQMEGWEPC